MNKFFCLILFFLVVLFSNLNAKENIMILKLKDGEVKIELFTEEAPTC